MTVEKRDSTHRRNWFNKGIALALLIVSAVGAAWLTITARPATDSNAGLVVADSQLSIGDVWETSEFQWSLSITALSVILS
jgi:hypothetical protein